MRLGAAAAAGVAAAVAVSWWQRRMRDRRGVCVSLASYIRIRWLLRHPERLLVISDFDRTISTHGCGVSCHGVLELCTELGAEYRAATLKLKNHYMPIETDPNQTIEQKLPQMQEWYRQAHSLLAAEPLTEAVIERAAQTSAVELRPGFAKLTLLLERLGVPLIVCSAGLGNVLRAVLNAKMPASAAAAGAQLPIVSNWLRFGGADGKGKVAGFSEPLLHMFNKDGAFLRNQLGEERWAALAGGRTVGVVLGDGLGDATMADGLGLAHIVRIGFLNETDPARVAALEPQYRQRFDAIILGDGSFEWLFDLLPA
jgi:HAD superfamily hydrolase (TIGR01544 family)